MLTNSANTSERECFFCGRKAHIRKQTLWKKTELEAQLGLIIFNPVAQHELVVNCVIISIFQDTAIG